MQQTLLSTKLNIPTSTSVTGASFQALGNVSKGKDSSAYARFGSTRVWENNPGEQLAWQIPVPLCLAFPGRRR